MVKPIWFAEAKIVFKSWAEILDPKRWAIYQTEAIENCYSVWKFQDFSEKKNILKIQEANEKLG
jgi:hypothetical protein